MTKPIPLRPDMMLETIALVRKPGTVLKQDYLDPRRMSIAQLARLSGVPGRQRAVMIFGERFVTPEVAMRLAVALGTSAFYWLALQARWSLDFGQRLREDAKRKADASRAE